MNTIQLPSLPQNPFIRTPFWGREKELRTIYSRLISDPPQCCAIIGEIFIGKTRLLQYLADARRVTFKDLQENEHKLVLIYLDCSFHVDLVVGDNASVSFWSALYSAAQDVLQPDKKLEASEPSSEDEDAVSSVENASEIKFKLETLIKASQEPIIFVLDNFEEVAHLPSYNSEWLRAMTQYKCAYIVASRHLLYLSYQYDDWSNPSPLWNLFSDPIYLGLMSEDEVQAFLKWASEQAKNLRSNWTQHDLDFIRTFCGRHAELIRIACKHLFELRLQSNQSSETHNSELEGIFLASSIARDAGVVCMQLWYGLTAPELSDVPRSEEPSRKKEAQILSPHQKDMLTIVKGDIPTDKSRLLVLEQRGLIEQTNGEWRVFAEVMRQFVLKQGQMQTSQPRPTGSISTNERTTEGASRWHDLPIFTALERKVYDFLASHIGEVCEKEAIKAAVWKNNPPSDPALQKVIERIRDKIEPDPANPSYLIAIRGRGFMLREEPPER